MKYIFLILILLIAPVSAFGLEAKTDQSHYNWYEGFSVSGTVETLSSPNILVQVKCNEGIIDSQLVPINNNEFWYGVSIRGYYWENNQCGNFTADVIYGNETLSLPFTVQEVEVKIHEIPAIAEPVIIPVNDNPPVITIHGDNPQYMTAGNDYVEFGATVLDDIDGDISNKTVIDKSKLNTTIPNSYLVNYVAIDSKGNISMENRTVIVEQISFPEVVMPVKHILNLNDTISVIESSSSSPIPNNSTSPTKEIPTWIKGVFGWWSEGKMTDKELIEAIEFLVGQGIIQLK